MIKILSGLLLICLSIQAAVITPDLLQEMSVKAPAEKIRVNIIMRDRYDLKKLQQCSGVMTRALSRDKLKNELKTFSVTAQREVLKQLSAFEADKQVGEVKPLWIVNVVNCSANAQAIGELAKREDVESIDLDEDVRPFADGFINRAVAVAENEHSSEKNREIVPSLSVVKADQVWSQGYKGKGVLVGLIDTGVNYNHVDLKYRMWNGGTLYPKYGYDFGDNDNDPKDMQGHGSHCAGIIAGDGSGTTKTGVAPEATLMAVKILGDNGTTAESKIWQGIQFAVDNLADVISMSVGLRPVDNPNRKVWRDLMNAVLASGTVAVVAAANSGNDANSTYTPINPNPYTGNAAVPWNMMTPGDCPPPWLHPDQILTSTLSAVVTVGATDNNGEIASFSSRGPVTWNQRVTGYSDYPYTPGSATEIGLIKPDIVAPGVEIKSCSHSSNAGYTLMSGTSMATPLTAGIAALMISRNYAVTPAEICRILQETAANKPVKKNNTYGAGRVDALAAVNALPLIANPVDVAIYSLLTPLSGSSLTDSEAVSISFKNKGSQVISSGLSFSYKLNNQNPVVENYNGAPVPPNGTAVFTFSQQADFSAGGMHNLSITANLAGDINQIDNLRDLKIYNLVPLLLPFSEDFEGTGFPPFGWSINNPDNGKTWDVKTVSGNGSSQKAVYMNFFTYGNALGRKDDLISPAVSLSEINDGILSFKVAYRQYNSSGADGLKVYASTDNGLTFNNAPVYDKIGAALATVTPSTAQFFPNSADQWREESVSLGSYANNSIVLKFEAINGYSNNLFIDDIRIYSSSTIENNPLERNIVLSQNYPNPFNPATTISFNLANSGKVRLVVYNARGEIVNELINEVKPAGSHSVTFNGSALNSGVYLYKLTARETVLTRKMLLVK